MADKSEQSSEYTVDQAVASLLNSEALPEEELADEKAQEPEAAPDAELEDESEEHASELEADSEEDTLEDDADELSDEGTENVYTLDIEGRKVEVTEAELLKGYRRQGDFTRKFQELAEQRKVTETQQNQYMTATQQYVETIQALQGQLQGQGFEEPNPEMVEVDPVGYLAAKDKARTRREQMQNLESARQKAIQDHQQEQGAQFQQLVQAENAKLLEAIPEWKDPKVSKKERIALKDYGISQGFTEQEMNGVADSRAVKLMRKAMAYDELKGQGAPRTKKVRMATKTIRSAGNTAANSVGSTGKHREKKALERLNKSGSIDSAVDYLLARQK